MEMTCADCVSWWQFILLAGLALAFGFAAIATFRRLRSTHPVSALLALVVLSVPALWLFVGAYRLLFGPNWHGTLLR